MAWRNRGSRRRAICVVAGTAYLLADEAHVHPIYRDRLRDAGASATCLTGLFDGGWPDAPHRVLVNETLENWKAAGSPPPGARPGEGHEPLRDWPESAHHGT